MEGRDQMMGMIAVAKLASARQRIVIASVALQENKFAAARSKQAADPRCSDKGPAL
jgi:hypothetical protein